MSDKRYCIDEEMTERLIEHKTTRRYIRTWVFYYSDNTKETLTMTEVFKK